MTSLHIYTTLLSVWFVSSFMDVWISFCYTHHYMPTHTYTYLSACRILRAHTHHRYYTAHTTAHTHTHTCLHYTHTHLYTHTLHVTHTPHTHAHRAHTHTHYPYTPHTHTPRRRAHLARFSRATPPRLPAAPATPHPALHAHAHHAPCHLSACCLLHHHLRQPLYICCYRT